MSKGTRLNRTSILLPFALLHALGQAGAFLHRAAAGISMPVVMMDVGVMRVRVDQRFMLVGMRVGLTCRLSRVV